MAPQRASFFLAPLLLLLLPHLALSKRHPHPPNSQTTPPPSIPCFLNSDPCPAGSICTPTMVCGGQCIATQAPLSPCLLNPPATVTNNCPPASTCTPTDTTGTGGLCIATPTTLVPCTIGGPCPTASTCTPTEVCPSTGSCGGLCIATPTPTPTFLCTIGGDPCPTGSICTQTAPCGGVCFPTPSSFPPQIPCTMGGPASQCPTRSTCTPTMPSPSNPTPWGGACISAAPTTTRDCKRGRCPHY